MQEQRGNVEYLIHWKGFPREENEWKKASELTNAPDAIKDFHQRHPMAPRPQPRLHLHYISDIPPPYPELYDLPPDKPCICSTC